MSVYIVKPKLYYIIQIILLRVTLLPSSPPRKNLQESIAQQFQVFSALLIFDMINFSKVKICYLITKQSQLSIIGVIMSSDQSAISLCRDEKNMMWRYYLLVV